MTNESQVATQTGNAVRNPSAQDETRQERSAMVPPIDVTEDGTGITVFADLPGVSKEGLRVEVEPDGLTIEGVVGAIANADLKAQFAEIRIPRYRRRFTLSKELDAEKIEAELKHGVLRLRIPKVAGATPRRVTVRVG